MNRKELQPNESEKIEILKDLGIAYELIFLTENILSKSILDATAPVVQLLKNEQVHDYEHQQQGVGHKVILPCIILTGNEKVETKISLYRPENRGRDRRLWPGRLNNYALPDQVFAIFVANSDIVLVNLSDKETLDTSDGSYLSEILDNLLGSSLNESLSEATEVEIAASSVGDGLSRFEVSSYGWDSDVEGLVKRMNRGDIKLPGFQRGFVWSSTEQSRFIESLILGLPVPNIFLAKDKDSKTLNIIDGQQRLKTLQRYLSGKFPISSSTKIHEELRGRYFNSEVSKTEKSKVLEEADARTLSDSILHSIVIKPDAGSDSTEFGYEYNKAVIQIFRRLNTSGKPLQPQEVRSCIFYGSFDDLLHKLNETESWRGLFGAKHNRYKDVETILRFFALYQNFEEYKATMPNFLDKYMEDNRHTESSRLLEMQQLFELTTKTLFDAFGSSLFKVGGTFLLSKFDAVTVGLAKAQSSGRSFESADIQNRVEQLLKDQTYIDSTYEFINDTGNVVNRIRTAIEVFSR